MFCFFDTLNCAVQQCHKELMNPKTKDDSNQFYISPHIILNFDYYTVLSFQC